MGSIVLASWAAAADAVKIPRSELHSDSRMENMVLAAPTSMVPTAMGRTTLNQTELAATAGSLRSDAARQIGIEEQQQRDQDPPGDDAARDVDARKARGR